MFKSMRWRLFLWHSGILTLVVLIFAATLWWKQQQAIRTRVDAELLGTARMLAGAFEKKLEPKGKKGNPKADDKAKAFKAEKEVEEKLARQGYAVPVHYLHPFKGKKEDRMYFAVWKGKGELLVASEDDFALPFTGELPKGPPLQKHIIRETALTREVVIEGPHGTRILVGKPTHKENAELQNLLGVLLITSGSVLLIGLAGGWIVCQQALAPISKITRTAEAISADNLSARIDIAETESELGRLGCVLNNAFARLEAAFDQQTRFTADASHELRTPISVILAQTEFALRKDRCASEYKDAVTASFRAATRMKSLVDGLLTLARADAGQMVLNKQPVELAQLVTESVALVGSLADEKQIKVILNLRPVQVNADPQRLAEVVINLLSNAINYNRPQGRVEVALDAGEGAAILTVSDSGLGIAAEDQTHVFERFYRVDKARTRQQGGSGLGLAICKEIVETHAGTLTLQSTVDEGSTFVVRLPTAT